jgi:hypothetical protein
MTPSRLARSSTATRVLPLLLTPMLVLTACSDDDAATTGGPGAATITAVELDNAGENGAGANTAEVVAAAESFLGALTAEQLTIANLDITDSQSRQTWSNFPATRVPRKGVGLLDLSAEAQAAALELIETMSSEQGFEQIEQIRKADAWLSQNSNSGQSMFGEELYYLAVYGTPSTTEQFMVQVGGHHLARQYTYVGTTASITPAFTGTEPKSFELDGTSYEPLQQEADTILALFDAITGEQDTAAKLPDALDDILMGPGVDSGEFPASEGLAVSELTAEQQELVVAAMEPWVGDAAEGVAASLLETYTSQLDQTKVAYASTKTEDGETSYFRIDGPRVFIELINATSMSTDSVHWHGVYRDKNDDYGSTNPSA